MFHVVLLFCNFMQSTHFNIMRPKLTTVWSHCRLSHQSASSSIDDSDDDRGRRQPMERNIYSEGGDSSSDESSNDSFTASEFEADEPKVCN